MATIKIKPSHPSQGEYVLIEEADYDESKHTRYGEQPKSAEKSSKPKKAVKGK